MNEHQQKYWSSFDVISDEYRDQVIALSADMHNHEWQTDTVTLPLHRPLKQYLPTDTIPPPFSPPATITLQRIDDVTWVPTGDVQNQ